MQFAGVDLVVKLIGLVEYEIVASAPWTRPVPNCSSPLARKPPNMSGEDGICSKSLLEAPIGSTEGASICNMWGAILILRQTIKR
jgi:hypothetical protein